MFANRRFASFAAFTALFAVLAAVVFYGTWSSHVTFIAPDDSVRIPLSYADTWQHWVNVFVTSGKVSPTDVLYEGLLISPLFCRELKYVFSIYCAALALAYFLRGRGLSRLASYAGGLFLVFSGYWLTLFSAGHAGWFVWMTYGVFAFGFVDRLVATRQLKYALLLGVSLAWGSFSQPDMWLLFAVFTAIYFFFRAFETLRSKSKEVRLQSVYSLGRLVGASFIVFLMVGAPGWYSAFASDLASRDHQISSAQAAARHNPQNPENARWIFTTNWSLPPSEIGEFCWPRLQGDTSCPFTISINYPKGKVRPYTGELGRAYKQKEGNYRQHSLYVGFVTCCFALVGMVFAFKRREHTAIFFTVAAFVYMFFSFGRYCEPIYRLVYALPFGDYLRAPVKWHHLTEFSLAILAAFGFDALLKLTVNRKVLRVVLVALALGGTVDLAIEASRYCARVDYTQAISLKKSSTLMPIRRRQFEDDAQIKAMRRSGLIIPVANWMCDPNIFLVQVLESQKPVAPCEPKPLPLSLGVISIIAALGSLGFIVAKLGGKVL